MQSSKQLLTEIPLNYLAFSKLRSFATLINPIFDASPRHIKIIADALEKIERGDLKRVIITIPPRHGKSMLVSEIFPAWFMGRNPEKNIIFTTYNQEFASNFGRKVRNNMSLELFNYVFPETLVSSDSSAANRFHTTKGGAYYAVGAGSSITGKGAHMLIIDDPIKNREEADSSLIRQRVKGWYSSTAYTRLEPNGTVVIVQTRWHNDDLSGWLLKENKEDWTVINLPAIQTDDKGCEHALWSERYSLERLKEIRDTVSSRDWAALYQQTPVEDGGSVFKEEWLRYYLESPPISDLNVYVFVDPANSKNVSSDYTSMLIIGANKDGNIYLLDGYLDKLNLKEREDLLFKIHEKYDPKMVYYEKYGMQLDIEYMKQAMEYRNYRFSIEEVGGAMRKEDRIERLTGYFQDGKIWFPRFLEKTNYLGRKVDLISYFKDEEYLQFPVSRHDDMIDCLSRICDVKMLFPKSNKIDYYALYE